MEIIEIDKLHTSYTTVVNVAEKDLRNGAGVVMEH